MHANSIQNTQNEIEAIGLTAPRVLPEDIEAEIASEHYFTAEEGIQGALAKRRTDLGVENSQLALLTICVLVLKNGFTVTGESACASPANFDAEIGRKIARQHAVAKIWPLLGFAMRDAITEAEDTKAKVKRAPRYRCAITGEYVTRGYAEAYPDTTVKES